MIIKYSILYIAIMAALALGLDALNPFEPPTENSPDSFFVWSNPYIQVKAVSVLIALLTFPVGLIGILTEISGKK